MLAMFKKIVLLPHWRRRVSWTIALVLLFPFIMFFHASGGRLPGVGPGGGTPPRPNHCAPTRNKHSAM